MEISTTQNVTEVKAARHELALANRECRDLFENGEPFTEQERKTVLARHTAAVRRLQAASPFAKAIAS